MVSHNTQTLDISWVESVFVFCLKDIKAKGYIILAIYNCSQCGIISIRFIIIGNLFKQFTIILQFAIDPENFVKISYCIVGQNIGRQIEMKKMKRVISTIIAIAFVLSIGTPAVFASKTDNGGRSIPPGIAKKNTGLPYGIAKKAFNDIGEFPWAEQAIEKMRLKGLIKGKEEGKFDPKSDVTKMEAVIMALRIMGWEDESIILTELPKKYKGKYVDAWAKGYVSVAFDKGILDDVDMMYFNPEEPAKRHEVAKYIIRALGYEDEAEDHMNDNLAFKDASAIPQGSIGYVYLVNEMELMVGSNNTFNPMGTLTRAEMAVLFQRLDEKVDNNIDEDDYKGQIHSINEAEITLKINGQLKTFDVDSDVKVYDNNKRISYSKLLVETFVLLQIKDDEVVYIEVVDENKNDDKIISKYTGIVTDISTTNPKKLTVQIDKMQFVFEAISAVEVYFKNDEGNFDEIVNGDSVTVIVDTRNRAREIQINRNRQEQDTHEIEGIITDIDLIGTYHLSINSNRYVLSENADVTIPEKMNSELDDLEIGYQVSCTIEDNIITEIEVEDVLTSVTGDIVKVTGSSITLNIADEDKLYSFDYMFTVLIDNQTTRYSNLVAGMTAELKTRGGLVYQINASNQTFTVNGKITGIIQLTNGYKLNLIVNGNNVSYNVAEDVVISLTNTLNEDIKDLMVNQEGEFWIENNIIIKIVIED